MSYATLFELPVTLLYPWCDFAHCLITALQARKDQKELFRRHPVASLLLTLLLCSAGSLLTDLLLARFDLLFAYLLRPDKLLIGISAWFIVHYVPFLLPVITSPPLHNIMVLFKKIYRLRKVVRGIQLVEWLHHTALPDRSFLSKLLAGVLKGNGSGLLRPLIAAGYLNSQPLRLTAFLTSSSIISLFLSTAWLICEHLEVSRDLSYPALLVVLITFKLPSILGQGGVSLETDRETAKEKAEESISCKAQSKEIQKTKKEADDQIGNQADQDNVVSDSEDNHDDNM